MLLSYFSLNDFILIALIGAALFVDLTKQKIPNYLTFPAMVWGLISYMVMDGFSGFWFSFLGLIAGLAIFFIPFAMGGMGGGDVKLLGAVGALKGWQFVLAAGLLTAIAGGIIAVVYLIATGRLVKTLKKIAGFALAPFFSFLYYQTKLEVFNRASVFFTKQPQESETGSLPYGIAISVGVLAFLFMDLFPWGEHYLGSLFYL